VVLGILERALAGRMLNGQDDDLLPPVIDRIVDEIAVLSRDELPDSGSGLRRPDFGKLRTVRGRRESRTERVARRSDCGRRT